jgi:hypothetical protein
VVERETGTTVSPWSEANRALVTAAVKNEWSKFRSLTLFSQIKAILGWASCARLCIFVPNQPASGVSRAVITSCAERGGSERPELNGHSTAGQTFLWR